MKFTFSIDLLDDVQRRLQITARNVAPTHSAPPFAGDGLLQLRVLVAIPILSIISAHLHDRQEISDQSDHCPSIRYNRKVF